VAHKKRFSALMNFAYVAHTEACTFLLDAEGVCRWLIPKHGADEATLKIAERCVGAQYVASLDRDAEGLLVHMPKPGTRLLFACVSEGGRIFLVRSGPVLKFEDADAPATTEDVDAETERGLRAPADVRAAHPEATERDVAKELEADGPPEPELEPEPEPIPLSRAVASPDAPAITARRPVTEAEAARMFDDVDDDCETAPFSSARPASRPRTAAPDDTEPPTTRRAPEPLRGFPPPPVRRGDAPARRGMLPRVVRQPA
jgi:hypothetical protein